VKYYEINHLIILTEDLLHRYTTFLDKSGTEVDNELRVKLGKAESNLFKIIKLLEKQVESHNSRLEIYNKLRSSQTSN
jgi:hypothetical protein